MSSQYRTPDLNELHHGFPCEIQSHCDGRWYPCTLKLTNVLMCGFILHGVTDNGNKLTITSHQNLRVKKQ